MKTQVITLEAHDDLTSIQDKLSWAKTERILLVFPRRPQTGLRTLDLRLLQRQADGLGAQLAIVTRSETLRQAAAELGLPVFETSKDAQRLAWPFAPLPPKPERRTARPDLLELRRAAFPPEPGWQGRGAIRLIVFSIAVLSLLALLAAFLPSASLTLQPQTQLQSLELTASAYPETTAVSLAGSLPARSVSAVLEASQTMDVSGSIVLPDRAAAGLVRFRNLTSGLVGIPAGTVVQTVAEPPVRFATTSDAVAEAGVGKTVDVPVEALEPGTDGNLSAEVLVAFEGDLGASLAVINPSPTEGGSDRIAPVQTASDRAQLHNRLTASLKEDCPRTLSASLASGDLFFPETAAIGQVLSESWFPAEGQSGETLTLTLKIQCQAGYASADDLQLLARLSLDATLPEGFKPLSQAISFLGTPVPQTDAGGVTRWQMQVQRLLSARLDPLAAIQLSLGRRPEEAARRLAAGLPLAEPPKIALDPSWWPWLPVVPFRIAVETLP
jgi:hypothetical protein